MARKRDMTQAWFTEIDSLYRRILFRPVDPSGYETYSALLIAGDASLEDIAGILRDSEECRQVTEARERATRFRREAALRAGPTVSSGRPAPVPPVPLVPMDPAYGPGSRDEGVDGACFLHVDPTPLNKLQSADSVLLDPEFCGAAHSLSASERRYGTCSGVGWYHGHHLAVVNLHGNTLTIG